MRHTSLNFVQYVNSLRVEMACQHLSLDGAGITDICYEDGFRNVSNFSRQFVAIKGMSPSRFRAPTRLFTPVLVTVNNLKTESVDKMIDGKPITPASVLCTGRYDAGCKKLAIAK